MSNFFKIALFCLLPVVTMITGGTIAVFKHPGGNLRSFILHFAAGVVFSVAGIEILPDIMKKHSPVMMALGFVIGAAVMIGIRKLTEKKEKTGNIQKRIPWILFIAIAVDIFIDGLLLGIGFAAGKKEGILLAIALSLELLSVGIAFATETMENKINRKMTFGLTAGLSFIFLFSAFASVLLFQNLSREVMEVILSFGLSALLFLVTEELLTEAHEQKETIWHTAAFFLGFLIFMILGMYT